MKSRCRRDSIGGFRQVPSNSIGRMHQLGEDAIIKITFCLHRLPALSREEFFEYWFTRHAPLVRRQRAALRMRRYVQCHTLETPLNAAMARPRGAPDEIYDGYAQVWWDSLDEMRAAMETAEGREAGRLLIEDEKRFVDLGRSPIWLGEEKPIFA